MPHGNFETIKISVEGKEIDFPLARRSSEDIVSTLLTDSILREIL
jgi:hypothetical protein